MLLAVLIAAQIELRHGHAAPAGSIIAVEHSGILLALAPREAAPEGQPQPAARNLAIGWDRIQNITGEHGQAAAPFMDSAEAAWRARTRLERGDARMAEPLFEQLFSEYRAAEALGSATGSVIAEGLLRCRLRHGAHMAAIEPWLALLQSRNEGSPEIYGADWAIQAGLPPVIDQSTGLTPALPPIWLPWPAVDGFARSSNIDPPPSEGPIADRAHAMAAIYLHAARAEVGIQSALPVVRSADPGVQLALAIVQARSGDTEQRQRARQRLEERLRPPTANAPDTPVWVEAWCRAAIGRSLLAEPSLDLKRRGILELLHLPARFSRSHPYLAGLALAESAAALREMGDPESADILMRELRETYPTHPVHDWNPLRRMAGRPAPGAGEQANQQADPLNETKGP